MKTALSKWMTIFISVTIMFTPLLAWFNSLNKQSVDISLHQALKKSSIEGYFLVSEVETMLIDEYNFDPDSIVEIKGTTSRVKRGEYIDAEITIKNTPIFVINLFNQGPETYTKKSRIMSEYLQ